MKPRKGKPSCDTSMTWWSDAPMNQILSHCRCVDDKDKAMSLAVCTGVMQVVGKKFCFDCSLKVSLCAHNLTQALTLSGSFFYETVLSHVWLQDFQRRCFTVEELTEPVWWQTRAAEIRDGVWTTTLKSLGTDSTDSPWSLKGQPLSAISWACTSAGSTTLDSRWKKNLNLQLQMNLKRSSQALMPIEVLKKPFLSWKYSTTRWIIALECASSIVLTLIYPPIDLHETSWNALLLLVAWISRFSISRQIKQTQF